jgi:hypothetical protein
VYLTGSHTWNNFQDWDAVQPARPFDFDRYLDFLESHGHNLIRLYVWEQRAWFPGDAAKVLIAPLPWLQTGPGLTLDGEPRFDLHQLDPEYFARLHDRVARAGARGIWVSVMLWNGWSIEDKRQTAGNPWRGHPFNGENNVNGINGDANGDGQGREIHTLAVPEVTAVQKAYLAKVVETLRDQENVLYEISNESDPESIPWQYEMIRTLHELERGQANRHPVGMTSPFPPLSGRDDALYASPADWISPHLGAKEREEPPPATGGKVVVYDTDHLWGIGGDTDWVWKTLLRGSQSLFMDPCVTRVADGFPTWSATDSAALPAPCPVSEYEDVRRAMGWAQALASQLDLARLEPAPEACSTRYCLVAPGKEYLVFAPVAHRRRRRWLGFLGPRFCTEPFDLDLSAARGSVELEWIDAERGVRIPAGSVPGGGRIQLRAPFAEDALLHARVEAPN